MRELTIAVSGASGFVGRHVVEALESRDAKVVLLQRKGVSDNAAEPARSRHRLIPWDLRDARADAYERIGRPDVLIHLAWGGLPNYRSAHHLDEELPAQQAMLDALISGGLPNLLVSGTCFEYGMRIGELSEDMEAEPANAYAIAKDRLRRHLQVKQPDAAARERGARGCSLTWARLFYLYGSGQAASSLWSQLAAAAARGDGEFPMSGGEQVRDFMPIGVAARELVELALRCRDHGIVNICSGVPVTVRALVQHWIHDNHWPLQPVLGRFPYPDHEAMSFWGSRHKLDALLTPTSSSPGR